MSGSSWNFDGDLRVDGQTVNEFGGLLRELVVRGVVEGVTLDRDDEGGEVAVADDPSELLLGDEHAGMGRSQPLNGRHEDE
jgi:hypothetical protein